MSRDDGFRTRLGAKQDIVSETHKLSHDMCSTRSSRLQSNQALTNKNNRRKLFSGAFRVATIFLSFCWPA